MEKREYKQHLIGDNVFARGIKALDYEWVYSNTLYVQRIFRFTLNYIFIYAWTD